MPPPLLTWCVRLIRLLRGFVAVGWGVGLCLLRAAPPGPALGVCEGMGAGGDSPQHPLWGRGAIPLILVGSGWAVSPCRDFGGATFPLWGQGGGSLSTPMQKTGGFLCVWGGVWAAPRYEGRSGTKGKKEGGRRRSPPCAGQGRHRSGTCPGSRPRPAPPAGRARARLPAPPHPGTPRGRARFPAPSRSRELGGCLLEAAPRRCAGSLGVMG